MKIPDKERLLTYIDRLTHILIIFIGFLFVFSLYVAFSGEYKKKDPDILRVRIVQTATSLKNNKHNSRMINRFDCSGYVRYVYRKNGIRLPRSSIKQYKNGRYKSIEDALPGDLIFFNTSGKMISHVGIYLGDFTFIHAGTSRGITINSLDDPYWNSKMVGVASYIETH